MAKQTKNYKLILPDQEDFYNVDDFNQNAEKLDSQLFVQEQEIVGIGSKLDVVGQNVIKNGTNINGVDTKARDIQTKLDALSRKLGTSTDTGKDTIFGALANQEQPIYVPNKNSVKISVPPTFLKETESRDFGGHLVLSHFHAEMNGYIYIKCGVSHQNHNTGSLVTKVASGLVAENMQNVPNLTLYYQQVSPEFLYTCPKDSQYLNGAVFYVEKGKNYYFMVECYRLHDITASFQLCYDIQKPKKKGV